MSPNLILTSKLAQGKTHRIDVRNPSFERDLEKQVGKSDTNNPQRWDSQSLHHNLPFVTDLKEQPMAEKRNNSQTSSQHRPPSLCLCSKSRVNKLLISSHDYPIGDCEVSTCHTNRTSICLFAYSSQRGLEGKKDHSRKKNITSSYI